MDQEHLIQTATRMEILMDGFSKRLARFPFYEKDTLPKGRGRRSRPSPPRGLLAATDYAAQGLVPLVDRDRLFFRVVHGKENRQFSASTSSSQSSTTDLATAFRVAFEKTWNCIPDGDQVRILIQWRQSGWYDYYRQHGEDLLCRPLIQIVDNLPGDKRRICTKYGIELNFPADALTQSTDRVRHLIARTLAEVYLIATGEYYRLDEQLVDKPLTRWEEAEGSAVTEAAWDLQQAALVANFDIQYEAALAEQLRRWQMASWADDFED
jgi:hypothetical protein